MIRVTVWNEFIHEQQDAGVAKIYPKGIHGCIAEFLAVNDDMKVHTATLDEPEHGLTDEVLRNTDVLLWWGHMAHHMVSDEVAHKVQQRVMEGMGLIVLHSGHMSKPFCLLMGTSGSLRWREGDFERLWTVLPRHPIAQGIGDFIEIEEEEMYGECFDVPTPDDLVFIGWFAGGEVMRSGCCWNRGNGKVFYFQPGHEFNPTFHMPQIQHIISNAVRWAKQTGEPIAPTCSNPRPSPEEIRRAR
jgi:trehalose utilization protein